VLDGPVHFDELIFRFEHDAIGNAGCESERVDSLGRWKSRPVLQTLPRFPIERGIVALGCQYTASLFPRGTNSRPLRLTDDLLSALWVAAPRRSSTWQLLLDVRRSDRMVNAHFLFDRITQFTTPIEKGRKQ
jgi:hypothetical protein